MKAGDPVTTPAGPGVVLSMRTEMVWTGLYSRAQGYITVALDRGGRRVFPAHLVKPKLEVV